MCACPDQVLAGVVILFSRVFSREQNPAAHKLWRLAEAFGARCTTDTDDSITHVIAANSGTDKVLWALKAGKHVVATAW